MGFYKSILLKIREIAMPIKKRDKIEHFLLSFIISFVAIFYPNQNFISEVEQNKKYKRILLKIVSKNKFQFKITKIIYFKSVF